MHINRICNVRGRLSFHIYYYSRGFVALHKLFDRGKRLGNILFGGKWEKRHLMAHVWPNTFEHICRHHIDKDRTCVATYGKISGT